MVVFLVVFSVVLQMIFLYGIYRENLGLSITYCVIILLVTTFSVIKSFYDNHFWPSTIWFAITTLLAFIYSQHLWTLVQEYKNQLKLNVIEENQYEQIDKNLVY